MSIISWSTIRKTTNVSDIEVSERLKSTALYSVLCIQLPRTRNENNKQASEESEIGPDEALEIPTQEELISRWPGMSPEQLETIVNDYTFEMDTLGELELDEELFLRVKELAAQDIIWEG